MRFGQLFKSFTSKVQAMSCRFDSINHQLSTTNQVMIATKDSFETARVAQAARLSDEATRVVESEPHSSDELPNSKRVYVPGQIHPHIRVPMREIELTPTKSFSGLIEVNEPVRVDDCFGPWGDPAYQGTVMYCLPV